MSFDGLSIIYFYNLAIHPNTRNKFQGYDLKLLSVIPVAVSEQQETRLFCTVPQLVLSCLGYPHSVQEKESILKNF